MNRTLIRSRRPKGSGGVRNRGTDRTPRWFAYWYHDDPDGNRRQLSKGPFSRKRDAETFLAEQLERFRDGRGVVPSKVSVESFLTDTWLPVARHDLARSTFLNYQSMVRNRLVPYLGRVRLQDLGPGQIATCYDALRSDGANQRGRPGGRLSETSIQHTHRLLHAALEYAVAQGLLPRNPADGVRKPRRVKVEMRAWDSDELGTFLRRSADDRLFPLWRLSAYTGMRRSEVLGLRWIDVDLRKATVTVCRKRVDVGYEMVEEVGSKSDAGVRVVDLDAGTVAVLRGWRTSQLEDRVAWGPAWTETGLVFTRENGVGLHADHVAGMFRRAIREACVSRIRFHDLRHTHATIMLKQGQPLKVVSERLGHASPTFTMAVYQHVLPGMQAEAARAFAESIDSDS